MKSTKISLTLAALVGMIAIASALAVPVVSAEPVVGDIKLYNTGDPGTAAFVFNIESPGSVALDSDYLNFTVSSYPLVSGTGTNVTAFVHIHINDGTTNLTKNQTLAVKNDRTVYSNASWATPGDYLVSNTSAKLTLEVIVTSGAAKDVYVGDFAIYTSGMSEAIYVMIPLIVTLAVVAAIIPMFKKIGGKRK